jgi:hypothetical protein
MKNFLMVMYYVSISMISYGIHHFFDLIGHALTAAGAG